MAEYTSNLNLKKPDGAELMSVLDINGNMDLIDEAFGDVKGLAVNTTAFTSVASLVTWLTELENNSRAIVAVDSSLCGTFMGGGSTAMTLIIHKGESSSYYTAANRDDVATGNINMSTADVTIKYSSNAIGVVNQSSTMDDKNCASGSTVTVGSISLPAGDYMIIITGNWASNANGYRHMWLSSSSGGAQINVSAASIAAAVNGAMTRQQIAMTIKSASAITMYVVAKQNSGSSLTLNTRYSIARIR